MSMEQGIVFDIQRFSLHDGPGIRTTVFLKGCPLRCAWCHNPESWRKEPERWCRNGVEQVCGKAMTVTEVMAEVLADEAYYRNSGGGLTVSGGEPIEAELEFSFSLENLPDGVDPGKYVGFDVDGNSFGIWRKKQYPNGVINVVAKYSPKGGEEVTSSFSMGMSGI